MHIIKIISTLCLLPGLSISNAFAQARAFQVGAHQATARNSARALISILPGLSKGQHTMMNYISTTNSASHLRNSNAKKQARAALNDASVTRHSWFLDSPLEVVTLASVILKAMAGGIIFIFSNTIMPSLATLDNDVGINIMNKINTVIVNPTFIISFFGGLISAYPTIAMWKNPEEFSKPARYYALASTLIFFFGEVLVTITQNVPRNNALLAVDPNSDDGANYWKNQFLKGWVAWNTVRGSICSVISAVLGGLSLSFMRKSLI